jgi:hypothetical protein
MLKKFLAGVTVLALSLGAVALTVSPAAATDSPPAAETTTVSPETVSTETIPEEAVSDDTSEVPPADAPDPALKATDSASTTFSAARQQQDRTPYVIVAWVMPSWNGPNSATWPQTYFAKKDLSTKDLGALDSLLTACGTQYQVDVYNDSPITTALIAAGTLTGHNTPPEDEVSPALYKLVYNPPCVVKATKPAPPTFTPSVCTAVSQAAGTVTIPTGITGVSYEIRTKTGQNSWSPWTPIPQGTVQNFSVGQTIQVRASIDDGYVYQGNWGNGWKKWDGDSDRRYIEHTFTGTSAAKCVAAAEPTWTDSVCEPKKTGATQGGYYIVSRDHVVYTVSINGGAYAPAVLDTFIPLSPGTTVSVKATAANGYTLVGYSKPYEHVMANPGACLDEAIPGDPHFADAKCTAPGESSQATYTIVGAEGVTYEVSWNGVDYTTDGAEVGVHDAANGSHVWIKAIALPGYVILLPNVWDHPYPVIGDCLTEVPVKPATDVDQKCVVATDGSGSYTSGYIVIPTSTEAEYFIVPVTPKPFAKLAATPAPAGQNDVVPGTYLVTASPLPGYKLTGTTSWTLVVETAESCGELPEHPIVTPVVTYTPTTCKASGSYTLGVEQPLLAAGVIWTVSAGLPNTLGTHSVGSATTVSITATPAPGYGFSGFFPDGIPMLTWNPEFSGLPDDCLSTLPFDDSDLTTLAVTGGGLAPGALGLAALLTMGGVLLVASRRREKVITEL